MHVQNGGRLAQKAQFSFLLSVAITILQIEEVGLGSSSQNRKLKIIKLLKLTASSFYRWEN